MVRTLIFVLSAALAGCGYSSGALRGGSDIQIRLDASRVAYVKTVTGTSTTNLLPHAPSATAAGTPAPWQIF